MGKAGRQLKDNPRQLSTSHEGPKIQKLNNGPEGTLPTGSRATLDIPFDWPKAVLSDQVCGLQAASG